LRLYRERHDAVLKVLRMALRSLRGPQAFDEVRIDVTCPSMGGSLRPDVQCYKPGIAVIWDVKVPWPRDNFLELTHKANFEKYEHLSNRVRSNYPDTTLDTIIVPSAGPMPQYTHDALSKVLGKKLASKTLCNMSGAVARLNYKLRRTLPTAPTGGQPRRAQPYNNSEEEDLDPKETIIPPTEQRDLDPNSGSTVATRMGASPPEPAPVNSGARVSPDGSHVGALPSGQHAD
jgi:hypothetical protein